MDPTISIVSGVLGFPLILFGFIALMRYLSYRETIALAEKGLVRPQKAGGNGKNALRWGIVIASIGLALIVGLFPLHVGPVMLVGLIPTFFGLGLVLIYVLTRESEKGEEAKDS
jgi:hypothetical protein